MDKIEKFLKALTKKEQEAILLILFQIEKDFTKLPGLVRLVGAKNLFRVGLGKYRIIFRVEGKNPEIIRISKRDEQTYRNL